jgi:predicted transcriptional regulator
MARPQSIDLTEVELRVMEVVWQKEKATVAEVVEALAQPSRPAYNTVLTTMTILERKGYLRHTPARLGRAFIYHPVVSRGRASRNAVKRLLNRFFENSAEALVLNVIENEKLSDAELARVRELLKEKLR